MVRIVVISDTHCNRWEDVPLPIRKAAEEADWAVHCGDYTRPGVVKGMQEHCRDFVGVYGNIDVWEVRRLLPSKKVLEIEGKKIGITHPAWGGPPFDPEELLSEFKDKVDAILFGHLHEVWNTWGKGVLLLSPGQGYSSFGVPAAFATLTIERGELKGEITMVK